jgi:hypothetical protein
MFNVFNDKILFLDRWHICFSIKRTIVLLNADKTALENMPCSAWIPLHLRIQANGMKFIHFMKLSWR